MDISFFESVINTLDMATINFGQFSFSLTSVVWLLLQLSILFWASRFLSAFAKRHLKKFVKGRSNKEIVSIVIDSSVYFISFLIALRILGLELTTFAFVGGAAGLGLGFGLQKITSNFVSGLILLFEKSIEVDDLIEIDGGIYGWVRKLSGRYTLIETFDGKEIMIPNEDFMTHKVINWTFSNTRGRIETTIGVAYGSDLELVQRLILEAASEHPDCLQDPPPECHMVEYADSSINFVMFMWVSDVTRGRFKPRSEVLMAIWKKFELHNITIPFPQRDVHMIPPKG